MAKPVIIPPKPKPRENPFGLALAQGQVIELTFKVAELQEEILSLNRRRRGWKWIALTLIAYIIF